MTTCIRVPHDYPRNMIRWPHLTLCFDASNIDTSLASSSLLIGKNDCKSHHSFSCLNLHAFSARNLRTLVTHLHPASRKELVRRTSAKDKSLLESVCEAPSLSVILLMQHTLCVWVGSHSFLRAAAAFWTLLFLTQTTQTFSVSKLQRCLFFLEESLVFLFRVWLRKPQRHTGLCIFIAFVHAFIEWIITQLIRKPVLKACLHMTELKGWMWLT